MSLKLLNKLGKVYQVTRRSSQ